MKRLVLFDIDGTLIDCGGAGKRALLRALAEVRDVRGDLGTYTFHGRTDPIIVSDLIAAWSGVMLPNDGPEVQAVLVRYGEILAAEIDGVAVRVMPGIEALLADLAAEPDVVLGLLTGNIETGARLKLAATGLLDYFSVAAYGSDGLTRRDLPPVALARARRLQGRAFRGKEAVVIGDTPADIDCGAHHGLRTIAVATGRHGVVELARHGPDFTFADLSDLAAVGAAIRDELP